MVWFFFLNAWTLKCAIYVSLERVLVVDFREKKFEGPHCVPFCRSKRVAVERNSGILMLVISCIIYVYYTCKYLKKMLNQKQKHR